MAEIETLGIIDEIQILVSDKLQVVSYKWLSRNFLVSSNAAKRLLQEFVEKHGSGIEIVYTLSGWLKNNPSVYHIRLVSRPKLAEAKQEFDGNCSVHVYSVQACIPKDPAAIWNTEFVQAEELFKQPPTVDNCLRDNRFCGVSNSFVKRNSEGTPVSTAAPLAKSAVQGQSKTNSAQQTATVSQPQQRKTQLSSPNIGWSPNAVKNVKSESHGTSGHEQGNKPAPKKENVLQLPASKTTSQNDKSFSGSGGSLANMWGRVSVNSKSNCPAAETINSITKSAASSEAQVCAREAEDGNIDDDGQNFNIRRTSNGEGSRKRRVVFDFSDEEDEYKDAVNLASPDPPKKPSSGDSKESSKTSLPEKNSLNFEEKKEDKPKVKEEKETAIKSSQLSREESSAANKSNNTGISSLDKFPNHIPVSDASSMDKVTDDAPNSPKRRKVLKTRIDERGREVTEVVWEGEEPETKPDSNTMKKANNRTVNSTVNRPPPAKKSPAFGSNAPSNQAGKTGNKKAGNKDPKQGNIMSFFKKV
ncbi:unnamed protein product [Ilex paraguariensis]|uniref:DNA polymerase delta subunit 3 n=1 Tax=Ilex paraguariensis TaxID=185542 RepID=A0ABC8S3D4_9AQUA